MGLSEETHLRTGSISRMTTPICLRRARSRVWSSMSVLPCGLRAGCQLALERGNGAFVSALRVGACRDCA
jgi:hypothetical protein